MNVFRKIEDLQPCPFDPVHMILPHRMAQHIIKCKKNHPDKVRTMKSCPFNANHLIPEKEFLAHIVECPDNIVVERDLFIHQRDDQVTDGDIEEPPQPKPFFNEPDESWDCEYISSSFRPLKSVLYKEFIRQPPPGLGKAGRKEWSEKEHLRVERIKKGLPIDDIVFPSIDGYESLGSSFAQVKENIKASNLELFSSSTTAQAAQASTSAPTPPSPIEKKPNLMLATNPLRKPRETSSLNNRIAANIFGKKSNKPSVSDIKRFMESMSFDQKDSISEVSPFSFEPKKASIGRGSFITNIEGLSTK